jgi:hypothetical protein
MLEGNAKAWKVLPSMPKPDSHIEFAWAVANHSLFILGGTTEPKQGSKRMVLVGDVFEFNFKTQVMHILH